MRFGLAEALVAIAVVCGAGCGDDDDGEAAAPNDAASEGASHGTSGSGPSGRPTLPADAAASNDAGRTGTGGVDSGRAGASGSEAGQGGTTADAAVDAGAEHQRALPTGIVSTSAASYSASGGYQLHLSVGAPQPYGDSRSNGFFLRLGVYRPQ